MRVVLMGPQGSGKGTQGTRLAEVWQVPHLATGDMLRRVMEQEDSPRAQEIRQINQGSHVSDALIGELLYTRLSEPDAQCGFVLDGYPRNLVQAQLLEDWLVSQGHSLDAVVALEVPHEILLERLLQRAQKEGRTDDTRHESITRRLALYAQYTLPVLSFYEERGLLRRVDATGMPEEVTVQILVATLKK
jgi:adenylate kinase